MVVPAPVLPPEPLDGFVVVVVDDDGFVVAVVVVDAALDELELDPVDALEELDVLVLDELELVDDEDEDDDDCCALGLVVVVADALVDVFFLPPRSPGCATAKATPATTSTIAAMRRGTVLDLMLGERVTGVEPASPAWKAGALPLSYTRESGWTVVGRTLFLFHHCPPKPIRGGSCRVGEAGFEPATSCSQ